MVKLIGLSLIDWGAYLKEASTLLGRSPSRNIDSANLKAEGVENFLITLNEFKTKDSNTELLDTSHIYLVFLVQLTEKSLTQLLISQTRLSYTINEGERKEEVFIMSGSVGSIMEVIKTYLIKETKKIELRKLCNELFDILESLGFKQLTSKYRKNYLLDNTFTLSRK